MVVTDACSALAVDKPRDRDGSLEPQLVKKPQRRLFDVDEVVLSLEAKGLTAGEILAHIAGCRKTTSWKPAHRRFGWVSLPAAKIIRSR